MGVVYRGKDPFIGRTVAIKTITGNFTDNPDLLERFYREARAAGGLQHANIVTIYDMGEDSGTPYIAMELLEGDDLGRLVEKEREEGGNPLPASIKLSYIVQVCRALEYAHKRNIVHRDIKPGNIVVTNDGTVKVVDFGIARLTDTSSTSSGMLIGTIDYMSPEQIRGEKVDGRSDIWAVGVMMYEILAYTKPFQGGNITAVMFAIVSQEPKPIRDLRPDLPPELDDVLRRIFKKEPAERYQNMEELLVDLEPVARKMQQESVGVLVSQSESLFNEGDFPRAKEMLKQALVLDTTNLHAKTLLERVNSAIKQGEMRPRLEAMIAKAEELFQSGNMEDAQREANAALHMDSNYQPARELLGKLQEAEMQLKIVQTGLREAKQKLAEGSLTEADQSLERVLKTAPDNDEAQLLRKQITEEKERRSKRRQLNEGVTKARQFWTAQQFDEALKVLAGLEKDFPGESEVAKLLDAVKADKAQDEIQRALADARKQLGAQSFNEALNTLDKLLQRYPNESAAVKLRELVLQERSEHAKQLRLQKELESLKKQVNEEKFADAISTGEALLKEFPDDFELGRLIEFAKAQRAQQDVLKRRQSRHQEINNLVQDSNFDAALTACKEALKDFPGDAEFKQRLEQITAQQKEAKARERQKLLDERLRAMKQSIERGDLTGAIDIGNQTVTLTGKDTDLTKLMEMAKQERSLRDLARRHDEQTMKAIDLLEDKKFEEAAKILRVLERDDIQDPRVASLMRAAEDHRVPGREDLALMRSKPVQGPPSDAGDKTRIGVFGGGAKPAPVATPGGDAGGATRVFRPGGELADDTTVRSKGPLTPAPAGVPAGVQAAAVAPPAPPEEKTTIVPPVADKTTIVPPTGEKTTIGPITEIGEKTAITPPKTKEEKKKQKEREKEEERARKAEEKIPVAATSVIAPPAPPKPEVKPEIKPEIKPEVRPAAPPVMPPPAPKPAVQPSAAVAPPPIKEPPAKPAIVERKEEPKPAVFEPVAEPKKGGNMGLIIGGVAGVVVIGGAIAFFALRPSSPPVTSPEKPPVVVNPPVTTPEKPVDVKPLPYKAEDVKKFDTRVAEVNKDIATQKYDAARKVAEDLKKFAVDAKLPQEYEAKAQGLPDAIANAEKKASDKAYQDTLKTSTDLAAKASDAIERGDYSAADQDLKSLDGLGDPANGNLHKADVPDLRAKMQLYQGADQQIANAKGLTGSSDLNALNRARGDMLKVAQGGHRAGEAQTLASQLQTRIDKVQADINATNVANAATAKQKQIADLKNAIHSALSQKPPDISGARAKLPDLQNLGENTGGLSAEIDSAEKTWLASQVGAECKSIVPSKEKWTGPLQAGTEYNSSFVESDLTLNAGKNCGLPLDVLQAAPKNSDARIQVMVDADGNVTDGQPVAGFPNPPAGALAAAKSAWHFAPPKIGGKPVKTRVTVSIHFKAP